MNTRLAYRKVFRRPACVRRNRHVGKLQITNHVGNAAIEKNRRPDIPFGFSVRAQIPAQHQLRERLLVSPRKRVPANRDLVLNDRAASFGHCPVSRTGQRCQQSALTRTWSAGDDEEAGICAGHKLIAAEGNRACRSRCRCAAGCRKPSCSENRNSGRRRGAGIRAR